MADSEPTPTELIGIWQEALDDVGALGRRLDDSDWDSPTACPGWTVADVVAHLIDIESLLAGRPRPDHEPDWSSLPHAEGDFSRFTEVGVDHRRGASAPMLLAELSEVTAERRAQLDHLREGEQVIGPMGNPTTADRLLRMRCLDIWVHEQDIRLAVGIDGGWDSRPAQIVFQQIVRSLPYVWARTVGAPVGATARIAVSGPGITGTAAVTVVEPGRGEVVHDAGGATVALELSWPDLVSLSAGRVRSDDPALRSRIVASGDAALIEALLPALSITP